MSLIFTFSQYCHSFTCFRDKRGGVLYWSALFVFSCSILTLAKTNITKHHMHVFIKCSTETLNCGLNNKLIVFYICNSAVSHHRPEPPTKQVLKIIHVTSGLNLGFLYYESSSLLYQGNIAIVTYTADLTSSRARSEITSSFWRTIPIQTLVHKKWWVYNVKSIFP